MSSQSGLKIENKSKNLNFSKIFISLLKFFLRRAWRVWWEISQKEAQSIDTSQAIPNLRSFNPIFCRIYTTTQATIVHYSIKCKETS